MKRLQLWVGILISVFATAFLVREVDFTELGTALSGANLLLVLACIATVPTTMFLKAYRWRLFFPEYRDISIAGLLSALYLGYMANTILPLRAGEVLRAFLVGESEKISKSTVVATVLIEKVFDLATIALFLFLLRFVTALPDWADAAAVLAGLGVAAAVVGLVVAIVAREPLLHLTRQVETRAPPLRRLGIPALVESFLDGLSFARDPRRLVTVLFWSLVLWIGSGVTIWVGLVAVGIPASYAQALFVLVIANFGMVVPSAPGYVGVFHSAVVVSLEPFGVDRAQALAAALVLHTIVFGTFIVGGVYYLIRGRRREGAGQGLGGLITRARSSPGRAHSH